MNLLRQRALESLRHKVRRGKVLTQVPIGFVRTEDDSMEMTPDLQVQEAIRTLFAKFRELGTVRQVLLCYHSENLPVPTGVDSVRLVVAVSMVHTSSEDRHWFPAWYRSRAIATC